MIEDFPALSNPVTRYLSADEEDSALEGRVKNAIEGLGAGALFDGLMASLRAYRALRKQFPADEAKRAVEALRTAAPEEVLQGARDFDLLGNPEAPAVSIRSKLEKAAKEAELGVPEDVAARGLIGASKAGEIGGDEVFINFARINEPEDIQSVIGNMADAMAPSIDEARRGVRTNKITKISADKVGAWKTLLNRRTGEPLNAEQTLAARNLWAASTDKLVEMSKAAVENPTPENLYQFRRMLTLQHVIQKEVIAARSETARALQSWAIPTGGPMERMRDISSVIDRTGGPRVSMKMAQDIAALSNAPNAAQAIHRYADMPVWKKLPASAYEYWINIGLLSGPKTHMVNMLSNSAVALLSVPERGFASLMASARRGLDESTEIGVEAGEALAQISGLRGGILDGMRNASRALWSGQTGFGVDKIELPRQRMISSGAWNVRSDSWIGRGIDTLGAAVNVPGRMLQAEDEFFKTVGYRMELHAQAHRLVRKELQDGTLQRADINKRIAEILEDPPESIRMEAAWTAAYQTFTNEPGPFTRVIQEASKTVPALRLVLPFTNTPGNILKYTFERTPLAPLTARFRNAMAKGGADADLAMSRLTLGSLGLMYAMDLALKGQITGSGPAENFSEMQNWRRQGNQPYSLKLGDKQYAYNRMDPLGYHLGLAADLGEYVLNESQPDENTGAEIQEAFAASVFAVAENITSKSYLQGLSMLLEAVEDPRRFAPRYLERFSTSFIPAAVRQTTTGLDPVLRHPHDIVSSLKSKLPYYSEDIPPRRDLWGREISFQSGLGGAYDLISPIYARSYVPEPIDKVMEKDGWFIGMGGTHFTIRGERVSLRNRPDIKNRYYELRGGTKPSEMGEHGEFLRDTYGDNTLLETLNAVVEGNSHLSEMWDQLEIPEEREKFAKDIDRDYKAAAKAKLFEEYPWIEQTADNKRNMRRMMAQ